MKESLPPTHSAYAAFTTVELLLLHNIIKEYTIHARISPKSNMTLLTMLADRLSCITQRTHKLLDRLAIQLMPLFGILQRSCALRYGCMALAAKLALLVPATHGLTSLLS